MTITDIILIFVIAAITGVTMGLVGIRKAIDDLRNEIRKTKDAPEIRDDS